MSEPRKMITVIVLLCLVPWTVFAEVPATDVQTKKLMEQFLNELIHLKPYLVSEEKFTDPANQEDIENHLREFSGLAKQANHDPKLANENFKFSKVALQDHIAESERLFRLGNKTFARWKLNSTVSICMSCHSQMPAANRNFSAFSSPKNFISEFDQAEFLFATRDFDQAFKLYQKVVEAYPGNGYREDQIQTALERQLAYFSRIKRDPAAAIAVFAKYKKNKKWPEYFSRNIAAWISQFEKWKSQADPNPEVATDEQILVYAKANLDDKWTPVMMEASDPNLVNQLRVSSILFEYLLKHPKSSGTPAILYWLAVCDRGINNSIFFSFADLYLKECILVYPASPAAKKCYSEYESQMILGYSGSRGTDIPPEVTSELRRLKELVNSNDHVELIKH